MGTPSSISVDDDLATSKSGISFWSANDKTTRRIEMVDSVIVKILGRDDLFDDLLHQISANLLVGHVLTMLCGDKESVDANWSELAVGRLSVFHGNLGLPVRTDPWADAGLAHLGKTLTEPVGEGRGERHIIWTFTSSISKHNPLITGGDIGGKSALMDTLGNVGTLGMEFDKDAAGLVVEALLLGVETDLLNGLADNSLVIDLGLGSDFSKTHYHAGLGSSLAGNP